MTLTVRPPAEPCTIEGDPTKLAWALSNLVANALRYTPAGGRIDLEAQIDDAAVRLVVADTGRGIAPEERERIFDRFYRSSNARTVGGAGIGLTVCKRLVESQSGRIWAHANEGGGLVVSFALPCFSEESP